MTAGRPASRVGFRTTDGDERLQVLLVLLLALCVLAGWLLIRALAPAADGAAAPAPGIELVVPAS